MRGYLAFALLATPAFCQFAQIATNADASVLLFQSRFCLQSEADLRTEQKIYRWQAGNWSRLAIQPANGGIIPGGVYDPFVIGDGSIHGWIAMPSRGLFPPVPIYAQAELRGLSLPANFPLGNFRISANGRFAVGDTPGGEPRLLDLQSGEQTTLLLGARSIRVASDGTVVYLFGSAAAPRLVLRRAFGQSREVPAPGRILNLSLSDDARWIAVESLENDRSLLRVLNSELVEAIDSIQIAPSSRLSGYWSLSNDYLAYLATGDAGANSRLILQSLTSGLTQSAADSPEPFAEVVPSRNGRAAWTVAESNRLWRFDFSTATRQEIASPLGHMEGSSVSATRGTRVPGSALLLPGKFTRGQAVTVDGDPWPISDVNADGLWVQAPWEWKGSALDSGRQNLIVRSPGNPFEDITYVAFDGDYYPSFPVLSGQDPPNGSAVVAAHQDFRGVVTRADPAQSGETIHVYMTGLGVLERAIPTGTPGPVEALRPIRGIACTGQRLGTLERTPLAVLDTVFAGGMIGIYQVEIVIPADVPEGLWGLRCGEFPKEAIGSLFTRPN